MASTIFDVTPEELEASASKVEGKRMSLTRRITASTLLFPTCE